MEMVSKEYLLKAFGAFNDEEHAPKGEWLKFCPNCGRKMIHAILIIENGERSEDNED